MILNEDRQRFDSADVVSDESPDSVPPPPRRVQPAISNRSPRGREDQNSPGANADLTGDSSPAPPKTETKPTDSEAVAGTRRPEGPDEAERASRTDEFLAAHQAKEVAARAQQAVASSSELGAVQWNFFVYLIQALMRILRAIQRVLRVPSKESESAADGDGEVRDDTARRVRASSFTVPGASSEESIRTGPATPLIDEEQSALAEERTADTPDGTRPEGVPSGVETLGELESISPSDLVGQLTLDSLVDPQVRAAMAADAGGSGAQQAAILLTEIVRRTVVDVRPTIERLEGLGGLLNLRLAKYGEACKPFGGPAAAARLMQSGLLMPSEIGPGFAAEVSNIYERFRPDLERLDVARAAALEAARQGCILAGNGQLRRDILNQLDEQLVPLLGKGWREHLALERVPDVPDDAVIVWSEINAAAETPAANLDESIFEGGSARSEAFRSLPPETIQRVYEERMGAISDHADAIESSPKPEASSTDEPTEQPVSAMLGTGAQAVAAGTPMSGDVPAQAPAAIAQPLSVDAALALFDMVGAEDEPQGNLALEADHPEDATPRDHARPRE